MGLFIDKLTGQIYLFDISSGSGGTVTSGSTYPEVNTFAGLPPAASNATKIYVVRTPSGTFMINRKEAGLYYSNGVVWTRLGDTPNFFNDDNFQIYDGTDSSKNVRFQLSGVTGTKTLTIQNANGTVALLSDVALKLNTSAFNAYSASTLTNINARLLKTDFNIYSASTLTNINSRLLKSVFNSYTGTTNTRFIEIENDVIYLSGQTAGKLNTATFNVYSAITLSNINSRLLISAFNTYSGNTANLINTKLNISAFTGFSATTNTELSNKVVWKGAWSADTYQRNDMVLDGVWTMIANKETTDVAAPQRVGGVKTLYSPNNPSISGTTAKQIVFGMQYSGDQSFWLEGYRTYVIAGNDYNIVLIKDPYGANEATFINIFRATVTGWRDFGLVPRPVASGTTFQILAIVQEPDPTPTINDFEFNYQKPSNWIAPASGQIVHATKRLQVLSIHHIDVNAVNRTAFLNSLVVGDIISVGDTKWSVQSNVDLGLYNDISVAPALQASESGIQTFTFETVSATPISIAIDENHWSGSTQVKGVYVKNGNWDDAPIDNNQYGIDIYVQNASISSDWDLVTAQANGGGTTNTNTSWGYVGGNILNQIDLQDQFATKVDKSVFTGYTATTETRIDNIEATLATLTGSTPSSTQSIQLIDLVGGINVNTVLPTAIQWTNVEFSGTSLTYTGASRIYIQATGRYEISYNLVLKNGTNDKKTIGSVIRTNGGSDVSPLSVASYIDNGTSITGNNSISNYKKIFNAGDYIELTAFRIGASGAVNTVPTASWIRVIKI